MFLLDTKMIAQWYRSSKITILLNCNEKDKTNFLCVFFFKNIIDQNYWSWASNAKRGKSNFYNIKLLFFIFDINNNLILASLWNKNNVIVCSLMRTYKAFNFSKRLNTKIKKEKKRSPLVFRSKSVFDLLFLCKPFNLLVNSCNSLSKNYFTSTSL